MKTPAWTTPAISVASEGVCGQLGVRLPRSQVHNCIQMSGGLVFALVLHRWSVLLWGSSRHCSQHVHLALALSYATVLCPMPLCISSRGGHCYMFVYTYMYNQLLLFAHLPLSSSIFASPRCSPRGPGCQGASRNLETSRLVISNSGRRTCCVSHVIVTMRADTWWHCWRRQPHGAAGHQGNTEDPHTCALSVVRTCARAATRCELTARSSVVGMAVVCNIAVGANGCYLFM